MLNGTKSHLQKLHTGEEGAQIGALFDFDGTIIAGYSVTSMLWEKFRRREMSPEEILETTNVIMQYRAGGIGFSGLMSVAAKFMRGVTEESYFEFGEELYQKYIARKVYPEARALIEAHREKGHTIVIVSSATIYQIGPTANDLDIEHVLCSQYEVKDGEFTGDILRPICFGTGKVTAAEEFADEHSIELDKSYFYSDSHDDIQLLERVGCPRVVNPTARLRELALRRGWPLESYGSRGRAKPIDYLRTTSATGSLVGAALAGLPMLALTGSKSEARNFATGLFGDISTALVGCQLEVTGEENLWVSRPCIFVFNHQSKADLMIMTKLVRKDLTGVAKIEAKSTPFIGKVMEYAGYVFVDRTDGKSAIKSLEPLIEAIQLDQKSVCIAPEGTRTLSPKLRPFKKGAFHMAMNAGVPMVPIVIHNAGDVAPKNEFLMRPATVRVSVLPPVDTSNWKAVSIDQHVSDVRQLFLDELGQSSDDRNSPVARKSKKPARKKQARVKARSRSGTTRSVGKEK